MFRSRLLLVLQLGLTLAAIAWLPGNFLKLLLLAAVWASTFSPSPSLREGIVVLGACVVFTTMNALALRQGMFRFTAPDLLGMPVYELSLWGFYLLHARRMLGGSAPRGQLWLVLPYALLFALPYALLADATRLLVASGVLLAAGLVLFHRRGDLTYTAYLILLGTLVEYTGVLSGQWSYPVESVGGVPMWYVPMWGGVGLLLHRLVLPLMDLPDPCREGQARSFELLPAAVVDAYIRRRAAIHRTPLDRFHVRVAHTADEYRNAFRLLWVGYVFQGLESTDEATQMRITQHHVLPESTVLVAYDGVQLVGTMTVVQDSAAGLPLDRDFPRELSDLRRRGARLVEYGSLTVVRRCWHSGVTQLLAMAGHWLSQHLHQATHVVAGMHPRVLPYYRALYCFQSIGAPRPHAEFPAPVQLFVQSIDDATAHFRRHMRRPMSSGLPFDEHACEALPPCIELPHAHSIAELVRWKLPRAVFRQLFVSESRRLQTLDDDVRQQLQGWRTPKTTHGVSNEGAPSARFAAIERPSHGEAA